MLLSRLFHTCYRRFLQNMCDQGSYIQHRVGGNTISLGLRGPFFLLRPQQTSTRPCGAPVQIRRGRKLVNDTRWAGPARPPLWQWVVPIHTVPEKLASHCTAKPLFYLTTYGSACVPPQRFAQMSGKQRSAFNPGAQTSGICHSIVDNLEIQRHKTPPVVPTCIAVKTEI